MISAGLLQYPGPGPMSNVNVVGELTVLVSCSSVGVEWGVLTTTRLLHVLYADKVMRKVWVPS